MSQNPLEKSSNPKYTYIHTYKCVRLYTNVHIHTYICTHMYALYTHPYICMYIYRSKGMIFKVCVCMYADVRRMLFWKFVFQFSKLYLSSKGVNHLQCYCSVHSRAIVTICYEYIKWSNNVYSCHIQQNGTMFQPVCKNKNSNGQSLRQLLKESKARKQK